jgi:hypothetical protein
MGLVESAAEFFPEARWQRCMVHFYRNVFSHVPAGKLREVALMLKAIHAQKDLPAAQRKATEVVARLRDMRLGKAAELAEAAVSETLAYYAFPEEHWRRIRTNNPLERIMRLTRAGHRPKVRKILDTTRLRLSLQEHWLQEEANASIALSVGPVVERIRVLDLADSLLRVLWRAPTWTSCGCMLIAALHLGSAAACVNSTTVFAAHYCLLRVRSSVMKLMGNLLPAPAGTFSPIAWATSAANELQFFPPLAKRL